LDVSSFYLRIVSSFDLGAVELMLALVVTTFEGSEVEVEFHCAPDLLKGKPGQY